ncbi:MAG: LpxL/LpxP family Kdo(2)-lipid IV(A) lauroyl/palmitoleoyl acyltransferase [Nitrospiraceae bacterium]|nr:LpxL/LpxP family Kdo(2)-lipid IV(A) lauroyl/palmitoleoyl acyltransferase [Nitrospiraceae bacterium]
MSSTTRRPRRKQPQNLVHPFYWPTRLGLALFRALTLLPAPWQLALGRQCGRLVRCLLPSRRAIVQANLDACFPAWPAEERDRVNLHCFESMGMGIMETAQAWWSADPRRHSECTITGMEYLRAALAQGRGVLLLGGHLHTAELAGRFMALEQPLAIVYRPQNNAVAESTAHHSRSRYYSELIHHRDMRAILRVLAENRVVWYAPDIDAGTKRSVFAPFFGVQAASLTSTARLAELSGAAVVPCFYYRRERQGGYDIVVSPALDSFPSGDPGQDAARINLVIETAVRRAPEQYFWQHRRFKSRPEGAPRIYC